MVKRQFITMYHATIRANHVILSALVFNQNISAKSSVNVRVTVVNDFLVAAVRVSVTQNSAHASLQSENVTQIFVQSVVLTKWMFPR